jgi:drug/metabolite transporter (DMT)-like permease
LTLSLQKTSAGIASTISTTYPIWVIPVAAIFLKEHPKPLQILCTILAVAGIALLVMPGELYSIWQCLAGKLWFG